MNSSFEIALLILGLINLGLLIFLLFRKAAVDPKLLQEHCDGIIAESRRTEQSIRDEFGRQRDESSRAAMNLREELANRLTTGLESLMNRQREAQRSTEDKLLSFRNTLEGRLQQFGESADVRLSRLRQELNDTNGQARAETRQGFGEFQTTVREVLNQAAINQYGQLNEFGQRLQTINETMDQQLDKIRETVEFKLAELQSRNEQKLEEMRKTVDEKLEGTLEKRLGDSFKLVSERLEAVHKGLGEMQVMANSVGDLKRVLTNVKTRGTWGEIQLGALLEQVLTAEQYAANVAVKAGSMERVEFAIKLPGRSDGEAPVWLPIDAKFPQEDYQRLVEASERADAEGVAEAGKALELRIRKQAKDISDKYIAPPYTTDFALLFLPSEGLYAEVLRRPGLPGALQQENRVVIAGPATLGALLNSLQMGFRTLAIQQRSSEVWKVLAAVKGEFGKFGEALANVKTKLDQASKQIEQTQVRSRAINRTLREVEALPAGEAARILPDSTAPSDDEKHEDAGDPGVLPFSRAVTLDK